MRAVMPVFRVLPAFSFVLCIGCGGNSAEKSSDVRWVLEQELRIGQLEGAPEYTFGRIGGVFPGPAGGVWVLEAQIPELRLYDNTGKFVKKVGRRGDGPGEFSANACAFAGPDREIWVEDSRMRWQRFDSTGVLIGSIPSTSNFGCAIRQWTRDNRLLALNIVRTRPGGPSRTFFVEHRFTPEGTLVTGDTIDTPQLPETRRVTWTRPGEHTYRVNKPIPFADRADWSLGPSGDFRVSFGDGRYRIQRRTAAGDTVLTIERQYTPVPVPDSIRDEAIRKFPVEGMTAEGGWDPDEVPHVYPPFTRMIEATDGRLWVLRQAEGGRMQFDVFSEDGSFLAGIDLPPGFRASLITSDYVYGMTRGEMDVEYATRFAIHRPPQ